MRASSAQRADPSRDSRRCESKLGNVVADALRATYGTDFALTNSGGLRAPLSCPLAGPSGFCPTSGTTPPFPITRGSVLGVLPFGNFSVTMTLSGPELKSMLERGVSASPGAGRTLRPSPGPLLHVRHPAGGREPCRWRSPASCRRQLHGRGSRPDRFDLHCSRRTTSRLAEATGTRTSRVASPRSV